MEKDVDEVGKIARFIKSKIEELDKNVTAYVSPSGYSGPLQYLPNALLFVFFLNFFFTEFNK